MSADSVCIEGIEVYAFGGVTEAERTVGQRYVIDISVEADLVQAQDSDSLDSTISYALLHEIAVRVMRSGTFRLIESPAGKIADAILAETSADAVTVRLRKIAPPIDGVVAAAGVDITRRRASP